jgi:bla regulator protein blaR1
MELIGLYSFSGEVIVKALSWTLLHSLWQGLLLSLVAAAIMLLTKNSKARLRYDLLVSAIVLFSVGVFITCYNQLDGAGVLVESNFVQSLPANKRAFSDHLVMDMASASVISQAIHFINTNAAWIVSIWLLVIVIKFIRLGSAFYAVHQLKHKEVFPATAYWNERISELCKQLKINKKVVLLQSRIVAIPSVIGYFRPVILFPAAMYTALPLHEVEAILIHELGHIRRNDFVVNLMQNFVEVVFFFNPAVIWVSSLIKTERENCCDDIALSITGNKEDYIKALIHFSELEQRESQAFATAFSGEKKHLFNRAKRIIYNQNNVLNSMEKKLLSASLVLVSISLLAFVSMKAQDNKKDNQSIQQPIGSADGKKEEIVSGEKDTIPVYKISGRSGMTGVTHTHIDGKEYEIFIVKGQITDMYIDGKKIPAEKIVNYKPILDKFYGQMNKDYDQSLRDNEQALRDSEQAKRDNEQALRDNEQAIRDSEQALRDSEQAMRDSEQALSDSEQAMRDNEQAMRDSEQAKRDSEQAMGEMNEIIDELIAQNIIKNRKDLYSLRFNADELIVNGVKQPTEVHQKFKAKFRVSSSWSWVHETK